MANRQILYGYHACAALLHRHPEWVLELFITKDKPNRRLEALLEQANALSLSTTRLSREELDVRVGTDKHQGVALSCKRLPEYQEADLPDLLGQSEESQRVLILDGVQDPHNLGACLRSANAFGVACVIAPKDRAVGLTDTVHKISSGAAVITPLIRVTNLARSMRVLQDLGFWLVGLDGEAEQLLSDIDLKGSIGVVMGAEGAGLRRLTREHCDYLAKIPMMGTVESLNVSVATGIALYEIVR